MSSTPSGHRKRRILLADDSESVQRTVTRIASTLGHEIIPAMSGSKVLEMVVASRPDVVVLDIEFPDADGRDILGSLKADPRTRHVPVVVWSGRHTRESDSRISLELGAEDYVEKSDAQLLFRKLERILLRLEGQG
jgi:CheY-like chemotaxis protein